MSSKDKDKFFAEADERLARLKRNQNDGEHTEEAREAQRGRTADILHKYSNLIHGYRDALKQRGIAVELHLEDDEFAFVVGPDENRYIVGVGYGEEENEHFLSYVSYTNGEPRNGVERQVKIDDTFTYSEMESFLQQAISAYVESVASDGQRSA